MYEPNCKCNRKGRQWGDIKQFLRWQLPLGANVRPLPRLHSAPHLHFHVLRSMLLAFFESLLPVLRRILPPAVAKEYFFPLKMWAHFSSLTLRYLLWICPFTTLLPDEKLFCLFFVLLLTGFYSLLLKQPIPFQVGNVRQLSVLMLCRKQKWELSFALQLFLQCILFRLCQTVFLFLACTCAFLHLYLSFLHTPLPHRFLFRFGSAVPRGCNSYFSNHKRKKHIKKLLATSTICEATVSRSVRFSFAPLQKWRQNHSSWVWTEALSGVWFSCRHKDIWHSVNIGLRACLYEVSQPD